MSAAVPRFAALAEHKPEIEIRNSLINDEVGAADFHLTLLNQDVVKPSGIRTNGVLLLLLLALVTKPAPQQINEPPKAKKSDSAKGDANQQPHKHIRNHILRQKEP